MAIAQFCNGGILLNLVGRIHSACHQSKLSELSGVLNLVSSTTAGMCCAAKPQISSRVQAVLCTSDVCSFKRQCMPLTDSMPSVCVLGFTIAVPAPDENLLVVPH